MLSSHLARRPTLLILGLLAFSLLPLSIKQALGTMGKLHSIGHVAAFTILMLCSFSRPYVLRNILVGTPLLMLLPCLIELLERVVWGGAFELDDVQSDLAGILLGLLVMSVALLVAQVRCKRGLKSGPARVTHRSRPVGS